MTNSSGTARRLFIAFAVLVGTFASSSWFTLVHVREIHDGFLAMKRHEEGVRVALELASAVRDQYAHQAHTIILGNDSHLPLYTAAAEHVSDLTGVVRAHADLADERAWVADIERATGELDRLFRKSIVPAVLRQDVVRVQDEHARAQLLVTLIQDRADRLVDRYEASIGEFQRNVNALQTAAFRWTIVFLAVVPLLALVVGGYVLRSVARPVERLREGAARLAGGDLDTRIAIDTPDEFGALARQFNAMTAALKDHQAKLVQSEKLAGIGRLAAGVAHEINNPLAVILGYARVLRRKAEGSLADDLQVIEDESLRAKLIVDGLLDLSRPMHLDKERVGLRPLCEEAVARLRETGVLEDIAVEVQGSAEVDASPARLRQVVLNLVKNAGEAAGPGGRVDLLIDATPEAGRLRVRDTGRGLDAGARQKLFEPFFTTKAKGTGLGLAISQGIVRAHGGVLDGGSIEGGGAEFTVTLPAKASGRH